MEKSNGGKHVNRLARTIPPAETAADASAAFRQERHQDIAFVLRQPAIPY
jgi:hypothetical protein